MSTYDFKKIEGFWQDKWNKEKSFKAIDFSDKPKYYLLSEFMYPSANGIHIGHVKAFTPTEIIARYKRLNGFNVLYPVGWDSFGLPTENYAIKANISPVQATKKSVDSFSAQLNSLGFSFDWDREFSTTDESYYKWTQWMFLKFFENNLAYKAKGTVNFCEHCQTVLSNEDSQGGECDRCHNIVVQQERDVWYLKMKDYSEKMLESIEQIEMKENLKTSQRNWIGKSIGAEIGFKTNIGGVLKVFTTRPDTLFGVTFMAIAPEHDFIKENAENIKNYDSILEYIEQSKYKSELDRQINKDKSGVALDGIVAINPATGIEIPIFVADYVMIGYGTGAIMAVPAHDTRDYEFAKKYGLDIKQVISGGSIEKEAYIGSGEIINSGPLSNLDSDLAKDKIIEFLEENNMGTKSVSYKMQDWPFNRQRYWGEPFPIINCDSCKNVAVEEENLPVTLPTIRDFAPTKDGASPLSKDTAWVNVTCPKCNRPAKRETDTMPNWAGSSWYWLRFMDPHNDNAFASIENMNYWGEVDLYTGGVEHVTRHMLYASFWNSALYDIGIVPNAIPFKRRMCNGLILDETGKKMSKSSKNAVDPMTVVELYGADAFRLHVNFLGDYEANMIWTLDGINGITRFLNNVWSLKTILTTDTTISPQHEQITHSLIKKSHEAVETFSFNTFIAEFMKYYNTIKSDGFITQEEFKIFLSLLNPYAPHITSQLMLDVFGLDILTQAYPSFDEDKTILKTMTIPVQVNGRVKTRIVVDINEKQENVKSLALKEAEISTYKKIIYVAGKIVNIIE